MIALFLPRKFSDGTEHTGVRWTVGASDSRLRITVYILIWQDCIGLPASVCVFKGLLGRNYKKSNVYLSIAGPADLVSHEVLHELGSHVAAAEFISRPPFKPNLSPQIFHAPMRQIIRRSGVFMPWRRP